MNLKFYNDLKSSRNVIYCFVATKSPEIISKIVALKNEWIKVELESDLKIFLLINHSFKNENGVIAFSVINDIGDYDVSQISAKLMDGQFISNYNGDSLISLSCFDKQHFACMTDFWGIMTHYWSQSKNTFISSNNIFLVSALIGGKLSKKALYEYLFFLAPRKDKTWFENIRRLLPGQQLIFNIEKNSVELSKSTDFSNLFKSQNHDLIETVEEFFLKAKNRIGLNTKNNIALSSGSDSRTILACLRHFSMHPNAISWGRNDMIETYKIYKLINKLNIPFQLVNLEGFEDSFNELFSRGTLISNGLLNPYRTHYITLYKHIKEGANHFEGILGSEFVKGEIAPDAMISKLHMDIITNGNSLTETIEKYYSELLPEFKESMIQYIDSTFGKELLDINTNLGLKYYQQFSLEFLPSKIFGGLILMVLANGIHPYYPFLSPKILNSIFSNGYGCSSNVDLRRDFSGPIKCLIAEAKIVKFMDKQIFNSLLDRNIKFKDTFYPLFLAEMKRKINIVIDILLTKKDLIRGQIDNSRIQAITNEYTKIADIKILPLNQNMSISNALLTKAMVNLSYIQKIVN